MIVMKRISIFLLSSLLLIACSEKQPQEEKGAEITSVPVLTEQVEKISDAEPIISSGKIASKDETRLSFKIGGVISSINVDEGDKVRKGQVLARLDLIEINAQVSQAQSALEKTKRDLDRAMRLYKDTVVTLEQVQNLQTVQEVAEADLQIAQFNQQQAVIRATHSGTVLEQMAEQGENIGPGSPVFRISSSESAKVIRVGLSDVDVVRVQIGDNAEIFLDAYPGKKISAKVSDIAASADPSTGIFEVELSLQTKDLVLRDGFVGKAYIFPSSEGAFLHVPMSALVEADQDRAIVFVPDSSRKFAIRILLSPYTIGNDYLSIPSGSYPNLTEVITEGAKYIKRDNAIRILSKSTRQGIAIK